MTSFIYSLAFTSFPAVPLISKLQSAAALQPDHPNIKCHWIPSSSHCTQSKDSLRYHCMAPHRQRFLFSSTGSLTIHQLPGKYLLTNKEPQKRTPRSPWPICTHLIPVKPMNLLKLCCIEFDPTIFYCACFVTTSHNRSAQCAVN